MRTTIRDLVVLRRVKVVGPGGLAYADLLLDTGAALTILSRSVAEAAGYDVAATTRNQKIVTGNGVISVPVMSVEELRIQELVVSNLEVCIHDIPEVAHVEGLLGINFLKRFRTLLDYPNGILEIT